MGIEIEYKFIARGDAWRADSEPGIRYRQGYLSASAKSVVRVRVGGGTAFLTVKGANTGIERLEFEYQIPESDGLEILDTLCGDRTIDKTRYRVPFDGFVWEVDEFHGANEGLLLAEVELKSVNDVFTTPEWVGADVSDIPRYTSAMLAAHPYSHWTTEEKI